MAVTAAKLGQLLAKRHDKDLFVAECKDGPTIGTSHFRMDAWVMKKSWSRPTFLAYEIKVARGDFMRDDKWHGYLPLCNQFYFVSPAGTIKIDEVPAQAGLIWCTQNGTRLLTKKKAPYRPLKPASLEKVFRYVLMSRCRVMSDWYSLKNDADWWRAWMVHKNLDFDFGRHVSKTIRERMKAEITVVASENERLKRENLELVKIRDLLKTMGIGDETPYLWKVQHRLAQLRGNTPGQAILKLNAAIGSIQALVSEVQKIEEAQNARRG